MDSEIIKKWEDILIDLKKNNNNLFVWLEDSYVNFDDKKNNLIIYVSSRLHKDTLLKKYYDEFESLIKTNFGENISFKLNERPSKKNFSSSKITLKQITLPLEQNQPFIPNLNLRLRFDNFIVGASNRFAHAACKAVAESPGETYNPLFIYGDVGLGKTHLLHAIGNYIYESDPSKKILITTADKFIYDVVQGIQTNKMDKFRDKYRNIDILLIDDVQFLKGDASTREFFNTFNELYNLNKQIVATSDRPPSELNLEERLKSRFSGGIIADIHPPDFETRVAILKQKLKERNKEISDNIIAYIAEHVEDNIRILEGTLKTLIELSSILNEKEINIDLAKKAIKIMNPSFDTEKKIGIDRIQQVVADYFSIKIQDLLSNKRPENIAKARQIAMYITRNITDYSLVQIGQYFGGKDHTTVLHAIRKIENKIKKDEKLKKLVDEIILKLKRD